jgi:hypothetical protein
MKDNMPSADGNFDLARGGEASARVAAVEAERARRRALQARREAATTSGAAVDGFALRKWRRAGVFGADSVRRIAATLTALLERGDGGSATSAALAALPAALDGEPSSEVPGAVKALLEHADQEAVAKVLICAHETGTRWLAEWGAARMTVLIRDRDQVSAPSGSVTGSDDPSGAFELFTCLDNGQLETFPARRVVSILPWAPLGVLDDLIDRHIVKPADDPWTSRQDEDEALYLRARLVPEQLGAAEFERLGWTERLQRARFLAGEELLDTGEGDLYELLNRVAEGDTGVLKALEKYLPRELVLRLRKIQEGAQIGSWDLDLIEDRGVWRLIAGLWEPKAAIDPRRSSLHALMALRHAYDLISSGNDRKAAAQVAKLIAHDEAEPPFADEAWNMHAYLALLDEDLDLAAKALALITADKPGAAVNRALLEHRRSIPRNDRHSPSNPYLDLGIPHRPLSWDQRYRDLRRDYAQEPYAAARVNRAAHRIRQAEKDEDWSEFFVLPLDREQYELPYAVPVSLVPPPSLLQRRTTSGSAADLDAVRTQAIADLLPALLTSPRRPDRHTRNPA